MRKAKFGFKEVLEDEKQPLVQSVFSSVASKYDIMNDAMSLGMHRIWKDKLISELSPTADDVLLDMAGGTGDVATRFLKAGGGRAVVSDLNKEMLEEGKKKLGTKNLEWVHANAMDLPFEDNSFDFYTISFGLRNVTDIPKALSEAHRVLKPMGKFACLEFSHVDTPMLSKIYDFYSFNIIPKLGKLIAGDEDSYRYLVESIRGFYPAPKLAKVMRDVGLSEVSYIKLDFGLICIHIGYKIGA